MKLINVLKYLSPLDVVFLTIESQEIIRKDRLDDCVPASFLTEKAERLLSMGEIPTRNPTYWKVSEGLSMKDFPEWKDNLIKELTVSDMFVKLTDLDNNSSVITVSCNIAVLAVNCKQLNDESFKDVKCARVLTPFGQIAVEI